MSFVDLKGCLVCGAAVSRKEHQDWETVRACSPACASILFKREHPEHYKGVRQEGP